MNKKLNMLGGWSIDVECYEKILEILPKGKTILELGSGSGTGILGEKYNIISIEHDKKWVDKYKSKYIYAPLIQDYNNPRIYWYDTNILKKNILTIDYDLILVDGPPRSASPNKMTRDGFRRNIKLFNLNDVYIIFDDIHRIEEMESMKRLVKELNVKYETFDSGVGNTSKKFGLIYPK